MAGALGELWIDEAESADSVAVPDDLSQNFNKFLRDGYTIFPQVVPPDLIDAVVADTDRIRTQPELFVAKKGGVFIKTAEFRPQDRITDIYGISPNARQAIFMPLVARFLNLIFQAKPLAMQTISFNFGSQQAIHQDTAYVISSKPLSLAATWLALEDVEEGTGELIYYPGSHRFRHFMFSGETKGWMVKRDGNDMHQTFLAQLHEQAKERDLKVERFLPRKGDLLVWHADLAHGGARITKPGRTRRSLVTHFCPDTVKPNYRHQMGDTYYEYPMGDLGLFSSQHYGLRALETQDAAPIIYDGGVTKTRQKPKTA